jgi:alkylated DNA repair protein (DNA oxidative demethylase)
MLLAAIELAPGVTLLPGRAGAACLDAALAVVAEGRPRRMVAPWGKAMSVAMTNCGPLGWVSDRRGYRYEALDPLTGAAWPALPPVLRRLAEAAAAEAGFDGFEPQACLVNFYQDSARMGVHQDRDEADLSQPIVSVSLGRRALFRFGGLLRTDPTRRIALEDGDVLVFGGPARLMFHGIDRLDGPPHPVLGQGRINLTFRHVGAISP